MEHQVVKGTLSQILKANQKLLLVDRTINDLLVFSGFFQPVKIQDAIDTAKAALERKKLDEDV